MKLKSSPEDFCVEELTDLRVGRGSHALYRLTKRGIGTPEAIQEVLHRWNLPRQKISYGGLKDRHALTSQHVSIQGGPRTSIEERSFSLEYLGQVPRPFSASDIRSNRFRIRLRAIRDSFKQDYDARLHQSRTHGLVNYFDDQRFGSIGISGDLIGEAWCKGNYERALYLAMAEQNPHDRPREKIQKEILREWWGQWGMCKDRLDRSHRRSVVTYLVDHPTDFKRALALIRQDLRGIYAAAFQSWVWNRWLSRLIQDRFSTEHLVWMESRSGALAIPSGLVGDSERVWDGLVAMDLPLPSARIHQWPTGTEEALAAVLQDLTMTVREMRFKYPRDTFFSKGSRSIRLMPMDLESHWETSTDRTGYSDWSMSFTLPRGAYATMAIRQWTLEHNIPDLSDDGESSDEAEEEPDHV
ncbi:MAG: tRNA pseudouridine(13) synthase TruD [Pirellula sp.]|jgi:tRNA pseudouridine13 synthase|nr:tRNA pseudouridine(13) synthase TruD [Pirellula sp.]